MSHIAPEWIVYIIIIGISIMLIIVAITFLTRSISIEFCVQKQKETITEMLRTYYEEIIIKKNDAVIKTFILEEFCTKWMYSPCGYKGICTKFKNDEVFCINIYTIGYPEIEPSIELCESSVDCTGFFKVYFNTRGVINVSKLKKITLRMSMNTIENVESGESMNKINEELREELKNANCIP
ncbi:MAG: hypothetical protein RMJ17_01620 [Candidatus Aenigmarchaeota archaeon]|nr:hypothetical protein [Candidatus Aenigmarchaeota archaeon]MDW8149276.1 hypothetical protein [Candidatus Aenigmarchaeota archaeon]